jgi:hypothetical protein
LEVTTMAMDIKTIKFGRRFTSESRTAKYRANNIFEVRRKCITLSYPMYGRIYKNKKIYAVSVHTFSFHSDGARV